MDLSLMLSKCSQLQWSIDDIDWDATGAELVTPAQAENLRQFMSDTVWIEHLASMIFQQMANVEKDPVLKMIFQSFADEEARHSKAELKLMVRWGLIQEGCMPTPNPNCSRLLWAIDKCPTFISPSVLSAIVPLTELILDGALIRYLTDTVKDPICIEVFDKINSDEARHLAVDFYILEKYGKEKSRISNGFDMFKASIHPMAFYALYFGYIPMLSRGRRSVIKMGLEMDKIKACMRMYTRLGERNEDIAKHPTYQLMRHFVLWVGKDNYHVGNFLCGVTETLDKLKGSPTVFIPQPKLIDSRFY